MNLTAALLQNSNEAFDFLADYDWAKAVPYLTSVEVNTDLSNRFYAAWITHGEKMRISIGNDRDLVRVLRRWAPPYAGNAVRLYRGESFSRHSEGRIGLCWTPKRATAECFGSGLQAIHPGGGLLLCAEFPATAIIAAGSYHSKYLDEKEFTVDVTMLPPIEVLRHFPKLETG